MMSMELSVTTTPPIQDSTSTAANVSISIKTSCVIIQEIGIKNGWNSFLVAKAQLLFNHLSNIEPFRELPLNVIEISALYLSLYSIQKETDIETCMLAVLSHSHSHLLVDTKVALKERKKIIQKALSAISHALLSSKYRVAHEYGVRYLEVLKCDLPLETFVPISVLAYRMMCSFYLTDLCQKYCAQDIALCCCYSASKLYGVDLLTHQIWKKEISANLDVKKMETYVYKLLDVCYELSCF